MENYKTSRPKSGCSHLQEVFTYEEIFGVLGRRSLMGGGHTWSCDRNNIYCREHQHALHWHYRLMTYVNYDIFHRSNYFLCHFLTPMNFSELLSVTGKGISRIAATAS